MSLGPVNLAGVVIGCVIVRWLFSAERLVRKGEVIVESNQITQWNCALGRRVLRAMESGELNLEAALKRYSITPSQARLIADSVRWRKQHRHSKTIPDARLWAQFLAQRMDDMRESEIRRQWVLQRFDPKRFYGNPQHVNLLLQSVGDPTCQSPWNAWRRRHARLRPDLRGARLIDMDLRGLDLRRVRLADGDLSGSSLRMCSMDYADLRRVHMRHTDLSHASMTFAKLNEAILEEALLVDVNFFGADLSRAALIGCLLNRAQFHDVTLREAVVWGVGIWDISTWDIREGKLSQEFLVPFGGGFDPDDYDLRQVRAPGQNLRVTNIELAHFIALVSDNEKIAPLLRTAANRLVLLLGRFQGAQAKVLASIRRELPRHGYAPIVFDFEESPGRDLVETVTTLAGLSRFVIADLTSPRSAPLEAHAIIPDIAIPFVPLVRGESPFAMFASLQRKYFWVLPTVEYRGVRDLIGTLKTKVITPAERMCSRLRALKNPER